MIMKGFVPASKQKILNDFYSIIKIRLYKNKDLTMREIANISGIKLPMPITHK